MPLRRTVLYIFRYLVLNRTKVFINSIILLSRRHSKILERNWSCWWPISAQTFSCAKWHHRLLTERVGENITMKKQFCHLAYKKHGSFRGTWFTTFTVFELVSAKSNFSKFFTSHNIAPYRAVELPIQLPLILTILSVWLLKRPKICQKYNFDTILVLQRRNGSNW